MFAPPLLLCLHQARFHGDITDIRALTLTLPLFTLLVKTGLNKYVGRDGTGVGTR